MLGECAKLYKRKSSYWIVQARVYALLKEYPYTEIRVITKTGFLPCLSATIPHTVEVSALPIIYEAPSTIGN
jgi:hypothetical protein